eukprot:755544_1
MNHVVCLYQAQHVYYRLCVKKWKCSGCTLSLVKIYAASRSKSNIIPNRFHPFTPTVPIHVMVICGHPETANTLTVPTVGVCSVVLCNGLMASRAMRAFSPYVYHEVIKPNVAPLQIRIRINKCDTCRLATHQMLVD